MTDEERMSSIEMIRKKLRAVEYLGLSFKCSFKFSIEPETVGEVKLCSYSELQNITDFKSASLIQETLSGRLFHGTIGEGSKTRPALVKTWDFLRPEDKRHAQHPYKFCDEIELLTDEKANTHPNLVKLYTFCWDTRLAAVYDEKFTRVLSDVLLADHFGWDNRINVATQLADLFAWFHGKRIAIGSVTPSCVMIDEELNAKVFDFGFVSNHVNEDCEIKVKAEVGNDDPEVSLGMFVNFLLDTGKRTMKSDIYIFGLLLLELINKEKFKFHEGPWFLQSSIQDEAKRSKKGLVHECFKEVDDGTASEITRLTLKCMDFDPDKRPKMKDVFYALRAMRARGEKRKRDENEAEKKKQLP
ncbi:wall-associated receptor kinase-like 8 [Lycium ferocissimum]|uniref:wall-associated receptor kinase-like 8 n=1 Tax=Lycium ferocissimum TaxID=112874 RepID=UPI0028156F9A|nr:wall-associated receptor kinase-like 8 [Lycium ferocissimum]